MAVVEIEVCAGQNAPPAAGLFFPPMQQTLRGRWDLRGPGGKVERGALFAEWPEVIPGVVVGVDTDTGRAWIRDPLVDHADLGELRAKIKERGYDLPPARQDKQGIDPCTWVWHMQRAVAAGLAKIVGNAQFPKIAGKPRTNFVIDPVDDPRDRTINRLLALVLETLPAEKRVRVEEIMDGLEEPAATPAKRPAQRPPKGE